MAFIFPLTNGTIDLHPPTYSYYTGTVIYQKLNVPDNARKLVKIEVDKESYGSFVVDDISLITSAAVAINALPRAARSVSLWILWRATSTIYLMSPHPITR